MKNTITNLSAMLRSGKISSLELTKQYISKIEKENPQLNAFVHQTFDKAIESAKAADKRLKAGNAPLLCGIPMALKDNICSDGDLTTCCSKILKDFRPYYDSTVWSKLKENGAVLLGKTNMDEFAMGSTSESSCYGAPKNPINPEHVTGGSSGGSAAAVCADLCAYALGSDTGGSIRQPASYCGVVGLKPTYGAVSRYGLIAYGSSLDQVGPLAKTVTDAKIVFDQIKGMDKNDNTCKPTPEACTALNADIKGLKIGIAKEYFEGINPEIKDSIMKAVKIFEENGAEVTEVSLPILKDSLPVYYIIACAEASSNLGRYDGIRYGYRAESYEDIDDMIYKTRSEGFGNEVKHRIILGTYVLSSGYYDAYYKKACLLRNEIIRKFDDVFDKCDILITPTAPATAPKLGFHTNNAVEMYLSDICTVPVNIAGIPGISIPCAADKNNMPIGMQILSKKFAEDTILNAAYFYEQAKGGTNL